MTVWPKASVNDHSPHCSILELKFIILWPQIQASTFISGLSFKVFISTFPAEHPTEKFQHKQWEGGRAGGGRPHGSRRYCFNRKPVHPVGILSSLHLWSVQPANHRAEDQPDNSTTGGSMFQKLHFCMWPKHTQNKMTGNTKSEMKNT